MIEGFDARGLLTHQPLRFARETATEALLAFPGKLTVDASANCIIVTDSSHHRLLQMDLTGKVQQVIGKGEAG